MKNHDTRKTGGPKFEKNLKFHKTHQTGHSGQVRAKSMSYGGFPNYITNVLHEYSFGIHKKLTYLPISI